MEEKAKVAIIGGGVTGLFTAYYLAKKGVTDVVVLEKKYIGYGASGRNGGGVRQQWGTRENIELTKASVGVFERIAEEANYPIWFNQGGYLILAHTEEEKREFDRMRRLQNSLGVKTRWLEPEEAREIVPEINTDFIIGANYNPTDGVLQPFLLLWGLEKWLRERGVRIYTYTPVTGFRVEDGRVRKVLTERGTVEAENVMIAAGTFCRDLAAQLGVSIPTRPERHEAMCTEGMKRWLKPMIISFHYGIYFSQSYYGEIVGGIGNPRERPGLNLSTSTWFLQAFSTIATKIIPKFRHVRILRQWAGCYDVSPDRKPIMDRLPGLENVFVSCGYSGHGVMISPAVGMIMSSMMLGEKPPFDPAPYSLDRFERGALEVEGAVVG